MALISGKDGQVVSNATTLADITQWSFRTTARNVNYASSATNGYRRQLPGGKEGKGRFDFVLNTTDALTDALSEGDVVELKLYIDSGSFYTVPAIIDSIQFEVDVSEGPPVRGTAEFSSDGAWTAPTYV